MTSLPADRGDGVDPQAAAYIERNARLLSRFGWKMSRMRWWLRQLAERGLASGLDVDLESGPVAELLAELLRDAAHERLLDFPQRRRGQRSELVSALSVLYEEAMADGLRVRPIPPSLRRGADLRGNTARLRAPLPEDDRARLERLWQKLHELTIVQQGGRAGPRRRGRYRPDGIAQTTLKNYGETLNKLLAHARRAGWPYDLASILTPERVPEWLFRGHKADGSPMGRREPEQRRSSLFGLLQRGLDLGAPLCSEEVYERIRRAVRHDNGARNVVSKLAVSEPFVATPEMVGAAMKLMDEDHARQAILYEHGGLTYLQMWREEQLRAVFYLSLLPMMRNDSIATLDLLRARRDEASGTVTFSGVRAKETGEDHVVDMALLPEEVDYLDEYLAFEDRSVERPLRDGETPQLLRAERREERDGVVVVTSKGDRWGNDVLRNDDLEVAALFRVHPHKNKAMTYQQLVGRKFEVLQRIGWLGAVPHDLRSAGAILWRYVRRMEFEWIMAHGHWRHERTLRDCYLALDAKYRLVRMAETAPSRRGSSPAGGARRRREALRRIHAASAELFTTDEPGITAYERFAAICHDQLAEVDRADAAERGRAYIAPVVPVLGEDELVRLDLAIRPLYKGGLKQFFGKNIFPSDAVSSRRPPPERPTRSIREIRARERRWSAGQGGSG